MYPIESLRIIAPIMLFVFIAINLVIGVFAGWKRAAYWGGGNFVFFIIGTLIWRGCSGAIVGKIEPLVLDLLKDLGVTSSISAMVKPVCGIVFGILIILITNLLLLINYYAWFKRVAKIGKYSNPNWKKIKAAKKAARKEGKKYTAPAIKPVKAEKGLKMQLINKLGGGIGFTALMLPPLFSTTTGIMYATTCTGTRYGNSFIENFYKNMNNCNKAFSWMSYYDKDAGDNIDGLMTTLRLGTGNIDYIKYGETSKTNANAFSAIFDVIGNGISGVINNTVNITKDCEGQTDPEVIKSKISSNLDDLIRAYNNLDLSWGSIIDGDRGVDIATLFNNEAIMKLVSEIIQSKVSKTVISSDDWDKIYSKEATAEHEKGFFWQVLEGLNVGEKIEITAKITISGQSEPTEITAKSSLTFSAPKELEMNLTCFKYLLDGMYNTMDVSQLTTSQAEVMKDVAAWMCGLMFYNEEYDIWK